MFVLKCAGCWCIFAVPKTRIDCDACARPRCTHPSVIQSSFDSDKVRNENNHLTDYSTLYARFSSQCCFIRCSLGLCNPHTCIKIFKLVHVIVTPYMEHHFNDKNERFFLSFGFRFVSLETDFDHRFFTASLWQHSPYMGFGIMFKCCVLGEWQANERAPALVAQHMVIV